MLIRRRNWLYRLAGQQHVHSVSFKTPMTASQVKKALQQTVGVPEELWGRSQAEPLPRQA